MAENFSLDIDLQKIPGAALANVKAKDGHMQQCLIIPIDGSRLVLGAKGCYLNASMWKRREPSKFGDDTHFVKLWASKEDRDKMTDEERRNLPIIGKATPIAAPESKPQEITETAVVENPEDMPF